MVFYASWLDAVRALPKAMQGEVLLSILEYGIEGKTVCKQGSVTSAMLTMVKPIIDKNNQRYENGCKGAEYGSLGGRPKKPQENPKETPKKPQENPYNVYDNDNVNDNEGENITPTPAREKLPEGTFIPTTSLFEQMTADAAWLERVAKTTKSTVEAIRKELSEFCEGLMLTEDAKELTDARRHFISWRRKRQQVAGNPVAGGRPYRMLTYEQMLNEMGKNGTTMAAYTKVVVSGKEKPLWVTKADKLTYNIPDAI